ncbi:MAG: type II toxin-antitoxin system VapC family toxin [Deltaproteobacteria bacterium]|nr:type II toxin-antitoxin system VapC family toxin [Deltaproteobacteria bacterium]
MAEAVSVVTSRLTYPEMLSAFNRRWKEGAFSEEWLSKMIKNFEAEWDKFIIIDFQDEFIASTKGLIRKHSLRGADSVHLSSALWLKPLAKGNMIFIACDNNLLKAAKAERLKVVNPQEE